jgi:hypothetical protein
MGNAYYAYIHLNNFQGWIELFGLIDEELIYQKRVLSIVSGAILPVVALGFIKSLVDYIKPAELGQEIPKPVEADIAVEKEPDEIHQNETVLPKIEEEPAEMEAIKIEPQIDKTTEVDGLLSRGSVSVDSRLSRGKR